jgi:hypothetical protein
MEMRLMLYQNKEDNISFYEEYIHILNSKNDTQLLLLNSLENSNFPGAILPTQSNYYICANSQKDWSILTSLVISFVGTSYSDFIGIKNELNTGSKEERYLLSKNISFISSISIPNDDTKQDKALKAFQSLYTTYSSSPGKSQGMSEYIDSVLENFVTSLQIKDIDTAQKIISNIKNENRLDALNIKFMQIELAYSINDWNAIVNDNLITHIINSRKPLKIRLHIIEAFYYEYLEDAIDDTSLMSLYVSKVRAIISSLLFKCPANVSPAVKKVYAIAYLNDDIKYKEIEKIAKHIENKLFKDELESSLNKKLTNDGSIKSAINTSGDNYVSVRAAVIDDNNTNTIESHLLVGNKAKYLDEKEQLELLLDDLITENTTLPRNWIEWLNALSNENFTKSRFTAEQALEEWPIDELLKDTTDIKTISSVIVSIEEEFAVRRFIHSLPLFMEACKRSTYFPNPLFLQMYTSILEIITVHEVKDLNTLLVSQDIVETSLKISPNGDQYNYILSMVESIIDKANGKNFIDWFLDYAELLISENTSDMGNRNKLLEKLLVKVYSYREWLDEFHIKLIIKLSTSIGIEKLFENISFEDEITVEDKWGKYINKTIGIYTLSENAARHAKEYLEEQITDVKIILNHDKTATDALSNLANTSDFVVLVTQSAKHAATGEIQKILRQKDRQPLFPIGKGSSSIISSLLKD